jgi:hypothetical protein
MAAMVNKSGYNLHVHQVKALATIKFSYCQIANPQAKPYGFVTKAYL